MIEEFKQLGESARNLYTTIELLKPGIELIESRLKEASPGVSGWVIISCTAISETSLGYGKIKGHWRLLIRSREKASPGDFTIWPFCESPVWMRLEAVPQIPKLLAHLQTQVEENGAIAIKRVLELAQITADLPPLDEESK